MNKWSTSDFNWEFGNCSASLKWLGPGTYTEKCCLPDGNHVVICKTSRNTQDWSDNSLLILGHRFCEDFVGYEAVIEVNVSGILVFASLSMFFIFIMNNLFVHIMLSLLHTYSSQNVTDPL